MSPYFYLIVVSFLCITDVQAMEWAVLGFSSQEFRRQAGEIMRSITETSKRGLVESQGRKDVSQDTVVSWLLKKFIIRL